MDFTVLIEIPSQSNVKYEVNESTGGLEVDRFLHTAMVYPFNYGYIQNTLGEDNDPMDAIVLSSYPVVPGATIKCQAVGLLEMEDEEGIDTKIIAVPTQKADPVYSQVSDIDQVPEPTKAKIKHFFEHYKDLEANKWVKVKDWKAKKRAQKKIEAGFARSKGESK